MGLHTLVTQRAGCIGLIVLLCVLIFVTDLTLPLGVAVGIFYVLPLLMTLRLADKNAALWTALVCSGLILAGLFHSPAGGIWWEVLLNRAASILITCGTAWFLTARKRQELRIREQLALLKAITESTPDAIFIKDLEGRYLVMNRSGAELMGRRVEEFIGRDDTDLFPPELARQIITFDRQALTAGKVQTIEHLTDSSGRLHIYDTLKGPLHDAQGAVAGIYGISRDITETHQTQQALQASETRYRNIFQSSSVSLWEQDLSALRDALNGLQAQGITDFRGYFSRHPEFVEAATKLIKIVDVNDYTLQLYGARSKAELLGSLGEFVGPASLALFQEELIAIAEGKRVFERKTVNRTLQGRRIHILMRMHFPRADETFKSLLVSVADITDITLAREALEKSEEKFRSLLESAPDGMLITNADGRIELVNRQLEQLSGYRREELIDRPLEVLVPERFSNHQQQRQSYFTSPHVRLMGQGAKLSLRRKDGSEVPVEISLSPLRTDAGLIVSASVRDISERRRTETLLRESEKLAATGRMAARVAHEINNPLAGIKNAFQLIKGAVPEDYRHYKYVDLINKEIDRIAEIVRQMYTVYRPEEVKAQPFIINETISSVLTLLESTNRVQDVSIKLDLPAGTDAVVTLPEHLLRQILYNLVLNAIDASPPGGTVEISAEVGPLQLTIRVANQGVIPEATRERIFEPFFTTKRDAGHSGMGLGLSVCRNTAEALGGRLELDDSRNNLTVFKASFPLKRAERTDNE